MSQMSDPSDPSSASESSETSEMDTETRRLDGNAAAGMLSEIFTHDMTSAQTTCARCGRTGPIGSLMLYGGQIGMVLRCPTCDSVQMRLVRVPERRGLEGQYWMDMRGMAKVRIAAALTVWE
jgi:hypothetical protein